MPIPRRDSQASSKEAKVLMTKKDFTQIFLSIVAILAVKGAMAAGNSSTAQNAITNYARPLSFEPNRGQTDKQVDFLAHGTGYTLFLSNGEAVILLPRSVPVKQGRQSLLTPFFSTVVRMRLAEGNASAPVEALDELPGKSNYFIGSVPERWRTGIPNYAKVRYRNVYPGVDMIYYGNQRQLEYDFVVSPGANPESVRLKFEGVSKAAADREGGIVMHTAAGDLRWHKPIAYQEVNGTRKVIECAYTRRSGQRLGFRLAAYDHTRPLIIDPELEYSTYLGGSQLDGGLAIAVNARGDAYVTGSTGSFDFPTKNAYQPMLGGPSATNAFVSKFDADGDSLVYSTYLGGSHFDQGLGIAVDDDGNAYVTGSTNSTDFPLKNAFQTKNKGTEGFFDNAFVTKLGADGDRLIYSTYLGGSGGNAGFGIATDRWGHAYVTGFSRGSDDFPTTKNAFQRRSRDVNGGNAFVTKFDRDGDALVYSTYLGGSGGDGAMGIAVDAEGHAYITGYTISSDFPTKNAFQKAYGDNEDAFVTKLDRDGDALIYSTYLGGSNTDSSGAIAVDRRENAYVTGYTLSTDFPTKNPFQKELKGPPESVSTFVTKLDRDGDAVVYSTYLGGTGGTYAPGFGIAVDSRGHAYVTGHTSSADFPTKNAFQKTLGDSYSGDAFVTKFDVDGDALVYSSFLGGTKYDIGNGIAVDANGNAYIAGFTESTDFPTKNAFQNKPKNPNGSAFVTKVSAR